VNLHRDQFATEIELRPHAKRQSAKDPKHSGSFKVVRYCAIAGPSRERTQRKGYGENGGKSICRYSGRVPKWLPNPNERDSFRHDCQRKTNNHNCAENNDYILARYKFGSHELNPSVALFWSARQPA
jgi:hypothetical protein